jgi:magnesium-transporting ATPase (P-type)
MYLFSGFTFELSDDVSVKFIARKNDVVIHILRINQFESKFQCMSVLVKDVKKNKYYVFVKGAAEKMQRSSVNKYDKYEELISSLSLAGLRNIAFGYKEVQQSELQFYLVAMREEFEKGLTLLGVVAFENKLKPDTVETIKILMDAKIEPKIITGDNIFIAVETALRTNILPHGSKIILLEGRKQKSLPDKYNGIILTHDRVRSSFEDITLTLEEYRNQTLPMGIDNDFLHLDPPPSLPLTIKLFARISPESKAEIVRKLKYQNS